MRPEDLIAVALLYVELNGLKRIRQANLPRALSTAYFALFHAICHVVADQWIGENDAARSNDAWRQAFRTPEHGKIRREFINQEKYAFFPKNYGFSPKYFWICSASAILPIMTRSLVSIIMMWFQTSIVVRRRLAC